MECHYKILGVDLNAEESVIKKAYRKAALKYHPDKNLHCLEEATEKFRLVQAAYDVLSDPQERAWYDRHREEILHRKKYENYKENSIDLWEYFSPSAYKGFNDDEYGFYAIYRDVFKKIDAEDQPFREQHSSEEDGMPSFGDSKSSYDDVVHEFYSAWQSYCTQLSYVWETQYDVKEAPNRRVARIIEKENKKERDKHKKKRNELIRELVSFVRKRDPRVKAHKAELESIAAEQAVKAEERRMSMMRAKAEEAALYDEANKEELMKHSERVSELENMMRHEFGFSSSDEDCEKSEKDSEEEEEYSDELFCVACNKLFKSVMGLRNHQKSKKHKENMNRLKQEMQEESSKFDEDDSADIKSNEFSDDDDCCEKSTKLTKKQKKQKRQQQKLLNNSMEPQRLETKQYEEALTEKDPVLGSPLDNNDGEDMDQLKPGMHESCRTAENADDDLSGHFDDADNCENNAKLSKKQKKQRRQQQKLLSNTMETKPLKVEQFEGVVQDHVPEVTVDTNEKVFECENSPPIDNANDNNSDDRLPDESNKSEEKPRNKKNRQKNKSKPMPQMSNPDSNIGLESLDCGKCNQVFTSRNKLFQHLKKTGHSLPINDSKSGKRKNSKNTR